MNPHIHWFDGVSVGSILASIAGLLPSFLTVVATLMAIGWYGMMMIDWVAKRREMKAAALATAKEKELAKTPPTLV